MGTESIRRNRLPQETDLFARRKNAFDPRLYQRQRKLGMVSICLSAELEHVRQHGNSPTPRLGWRDSQQLKGGTHGVRIGVEAVIDEKRLSIGHLEGRCSTTSSWRLPFGDILQRPVDITLQ